MRQRIKKLFFYGCWLIRFSFFMVIYLIVSLPLRFSKKYKNLWIVSERPDEARDNGYWLYKWILENKPDTNIRFVLSRKSVDYEKMPRKDLIIEPNSAKHYIYYILSSYSVSTHMHGACPGKSFCIPFLPFMRRKKTVFLQHGIIKDSVVLRGKLDAVVASAEKEKEMITRANPKYENKVHITGLCRYDQLIDSSKDNKEKLILVMPTFRKWLRDVGRLKNADEVFKETEYYKHWNEFLNSKELNTIVKTNKAKVIFFPHKEMQELAHNFVVKNKSTIIGKPGEFDVQNLLRNASVLVTDYSSVFLDFVYMNKPVIFFQFDQQDFFSKHYSSSGDPYPFGDIFKNAQDVATELSKTIKRGYTMKPNYKNDAKAFYKFRDKKNCERNYNLVMEPKE